MLDSQHHLLEHSVAVNLRTVHIMHGAVRSIKVITAFCDFDNNEHVRIRTYERPFILDQDKTRALAKCMSLHTAPYKEKRPQFRHP